MKDIIEKNWTRLISELQSPAFNDLLNVLDLQIQSTSDEALEDSALKDFYFLPNDSSDDQRRKVKLFLLSMESRITCKEQLNQFCASLTEVGFINVSTIIQQPPDQPSSSGNHYVNKGLCCNGYVV